MTELTRIVLDKTDKAIVVASRDDVEAILENNKALRTQEQPSDWGRHIASIPNVICVRWLNEEWERGNPIRYLSEEWRKLIARKLQDPDWAFLRTDVKSARVGYGA